MVENHFGEMYIREVRGVDKYAVYLPRQSFSKKTGWELVRDGLLVEGRAIRDRIHDGNGNLFTEEDQENRKKLMAPHWDRINLLIEIQMIPTGQWLSLSMESLEEIKRILYATRKDC